MKRLLLFSLSLLLLFSLTACKSEKEPDAGPSASPTESQEAQPSPSSPPQTTDPADISVAVLKGPTAMGMAQLMSLNEAGETANRYTFTVAGAADEITASLIRGDIAVAAIPCNLAATLYNRSEGKLVVAAVNTLGVLYILENGSSVQSLEDLRGKTIYSTGEGTTPEYTLRYLLSSAGIDPDNDVSIVYLSEASEVAARLAASDEDIIAMLPQPYVTTVMQKNESVRIALDVTKEWEARNESSTVVTGVIVINRDFLEKNEAAIQSFLAEYAKSTTYAVENVAETAAFLEHFDIFPAAVAQKALPYCNIVNLTGEEMQRAIQSYLQVLFDQNPASVGGALPDSAFYYMGE